MWRFVDGKRGKTRGVIAGLVPAISIRMPQRSITGMAGTSPAMTSGKCHEFCPVTIDGTKSGEAENEQRKHHEARRDRSFDVRIWSHGARYVHSSCLCPKRR